MLLFIHECFFMARISHAEFQDALSDLATDPGAIQYAAQDGATLAPVDRLPAPMIPGSRRLTRALPRVASALPVVSNVIDAVCIAHSLAPETTVRTMNLNVGSFVADRIWNNATQNTLQRVCRNTPNYVPPSVSPPFVGGQCPGVRYQVFVTMNVFSGGGCDNPSQSTFDSDVKGEIAGFRVVPSTATNGAARGTAQAFARSVSDDVDDPLRWISLGTRQNFGGCTGGETPTIDSINIVRRDGLPDVCGNPPPEYSDGPGNFVFAPNVDVDISPNADVQITPTVTADVNGNINIDLPDIGDVTIDLGGIDINFTTPELPIDPEPDPGPEPDPEPSPRPDPGDTGTSPGDPTPPPPPPGDPRLEEPEEEPEEVIRGVLVTVTDINTSSSQIFQTDNPDVYVPDLGLVSFRVRVDGGVSGWTPDQRVKNRRCFIPCEWDGGAFDVAGTPRAGVTWTLTKVYERSSIPST